MDEYHLGLCGGAAVGFCLGWGVCFAFMVTRTSNAIKQAIRCAVIDDPACYLEDCPRCGACHWPQCPPKHPSAGEQQK